ncbi:hypothetical protein WME94_06350 [Sorangium sp. So ce429]
MHPLPLFREAVRTSLPLVVAGGVWTRAEAEALLDKGATAVALGRAAILNPAGHSGSPTPPGNRDAHPSRAPSCTSPVLDR